ncbi:hypothetical protein HanXRQr2_Chr06g0269381 [Helianthus annuus]|uniref:Uncharacterized protein n=1 Tax=Helianthus annuus TaxID=4232 RepID=A0A251VSQ3_HELAN|nr:hypothetical protein HanXRQr2_Chr06g0269381 [Helianthus annuus]KAJ0574313.1 hypothetical protein HanHA89_Chr06g0236721 [Helianthus annuus]KAJ0738649.1 hypothetical protein HanLR1_Chr06g0220661 [Helianthus annuus]KAJ0741532.1 hypothetical protein HanOQP8_Chr06g0229111 [Helianthus annuus]KAJ0916294.1 hypothetical protein HanPSC8_Chr06g0259991 [Helianthus annuus]
MAFKVVERRDLHLSQWAAHLSTEEDLNKCEIDLSETLKWKFCLPTVYTFFHYLKQSMKLEFLNDGMAQDGAVADSIIIHSLFPTHEVVVAFALVLCSIPADSLDVLYYLANKVIAFNYHYIQALIVAYSIPIAFLFFYFVG